jgi:hypothetical protein
LDRGTYSSRQDWSQDRPYYSHIYNKAGVNYELGVSISYSRLLWMNSPFKAGKSDSSVFRDRGLKEKLRSIGKKAIGDRGYNEHTEKNAVLTTPMIVVVFENSTREL